MATVLHSVAGDFACCVFEFVRHQEIAEIKHEIRRVGQLVLQAATVQSCVRLCVQMRVGLNDETEGTPRGALGMEGMFGAQDQRARTGKPVTKPIKIAGVGLQTIYQDLGSLVGSNAFPRGLLRQIAAFNAELDTNLHISP